MESQSQPSYEELLVQDAVKTQRIERLEQDLQNILTQYRELKRHVFGRKSEQLGTLSIGQESLFSVAIPEVELPAEETDVHSHKRSKRNGRKPLPIEIPRERIEYEPEAQQCSCCGEALTKIGEEKTEELDYIPARFVVREHVRIKRACSKCKGEVVTGELPAGAQIVEKGRPGAGLLAHVLLSKYCDHLPLRQEQIFARHGVELSRSTLCDWVRAGADLVEQTAKEIHQQILASPAISADETPLKAQTKEKEGLQSGYLWGALGPPGVYFHYSRSRSGDVAKTLLKDYSGHVHTDAYAGYNPVFLPEDCVRVGCWAHVRRKFIEVQKLAKRDVDQILQLIAQLYKIEKQVRHATPEERKSLRPKKSTVMPP